MANAKELTPKVEKLIKDVEHLQIENSQIFKDLKTQDASIKRLRKQMDEKTAAIETLRKELEDIKKDNITPTPTLDIDTQVKNVMSKETILNGLKAEILPISRKLRAAEVYKQFKLKQEKI